MWQCPFVFAKYILEVGIYGLHFFSDIIYRGIVVKELFSETKAIFEKFLQYGWLFAAGFYLVYVIY